LGHSYGRSTSKVFFSYIVCRVSQGYAKLEGNEDVLNKFANEDENPRIQQTSFVEPQDMNLISRVSPRPQPI
jgi:hypothetical protein